MRHDRLAKNAVEAQNLAEKIGLLLAGHDPEVQGAALADLLALWLAGHIAPGDKKATDEVRRLLLDAHVKAVLELVPINEAGIIEPKLRQRS
jgi:hypothetical protein